MAHQPLDPWPTPTEILVIRRGKIVERGRHDDLIAQAGEYAALWRRQTRQTQPGGDRATTRRARTIEPAEHALVELVTSTNTEDDAA